MAADGTASCVEDYGELRESELGEGGVMGVTGLGREVGAVLGQVGPWGIFY